VRKLLDWASDIRSTVGLGPNDPSPTTERRRERRRDVCGRKIIVRQRKTLGIMHLKNLSTQGGCGITDMPLAVGSLVFLELRKPHAFAAEVRWTRCLTIGLEFFRPVRPEMLEKLDEEPEAGAVERPGGAGTKNRRRPCGRRPFRSQDRI
jgi:hypothetical protein